MLKFFCPFCNQPLESEEDWVGEIIDCPKCNQSIEIKDNRTKVPKKLIVKKKTITHAVQSAGYQMRYCGVCGNKYFENADRCVHCGAPNPQAQLSTKSKTTAVVLALCLGGIGIHHFYLGQHLVGILYVLFCWTYIPVFISFIEAIIFLCMNETDFHKKYC